MKNHQIVKTTAITLTMLLALSGCNAPTYETTGANKQPHDLNGILDQTKKEFEDHTKAGNKDTTADSNNGNIVLEWTMSKYPDYYTVDGAANYDGLTIPTTPSVNYSAPDNLGRSGTACALIDYQMRDQGSRRDRNMPDQITGWPASNPKVSIDLGNGKTYHGYLFNRSHLIAKSLGGEDSARNMITGTRTQNVGKNQPAGGMAYTETEARDWLDKNPTGTITYCATPNYTGSELLPRTVTVNMQTSDKSIDQKVIVWNTANGYDIDYQNGGVK